MVEEIRVAELKKSDRIEKELEVGMVNMKGFINKVISILCRCLERFTRKSN